MVNMKYYLILLIGVFLALGTGTIIGVSIQNKEILENQQSVLVSRLEDEFNGIRVENKQLKEELNLLIESMAENREEYHLIYESLIKDKLNDLKVGLITIGDEEDYSWIIPLLEMSGASLEAGVIFNRELFYLDSIEKEEIIKSLEMDNIGIDFYETIGQGLVNSMTMNVYNSYFNGLEELNLIEGSMDLQGICDAIIVAYNGERNREGDSGAKFCKELLTVIKGYSIPVVVVEAEDSKGIDIDTCRRMGISTIDHVNTLHGKLTLISLLRGGEGNFGFRSGTKGLIPDVLFPPDTSFEEIEDINN